MKKNKQLVPKRRFKEFENDGEWEQYNIKDIFRITRGDVLAATKTTEVITASMPYPVYSSQTKNNGLMGYYKDFLYEDAITWTTDGANAGTVSYRQGKFYCTNVSGVLLSDKGYANKMVSESINKVAWKHVSKVGNPKLMNNVMGEITISIPNKIEEQHKIANFLTKLDQLISRNQYKVKKIKDLKSAYLLDMFPREGEKYPKKRFEEFTEPWEPCEFREISSNFEYGLNASATDYDGKNKYIRITDIDDSSRQFRQDGLTSPKTNMDLADNYLLEEGDLLFARTGASVGKSYIYNKNDGKVYYAGFLIRARVKSKNNPYFIFLQTLTSDYDEFVKVTSQRSGQPGINAEEYGGYAFMIPDKEEQNKVANFFKNLDAQIALEEKKLNKLEQLKQAYLNELFV